MTALYRHYDSDGVLLYIGITSSMRRRLREHEGNSDWYERISRITIERYESRDAALLAEKDAICREGPLYNIQWANVPVPFYPSIELSPGDLCPHCGMKYRPRLSNADRQRRYRAKKK